MEKLPYDINNEDSILEYGKKSIGTTFRKIEIANKEYESLLKNSTFNKGFLGNYYQAYYYHIPVNSVSEPDFKDAGIELKVTGYIKNLNGTCSADERLALMTISYNAYKEPQKFRESSLFKKCSKMLLVFYLSDKEIKDKLDYQIDYVRLYKLVEIAQKDFKIIENDYKNIVGKIARGDADKLSESDTMFLCACRCGNKESSLQTIPNSDNKALPRRFALKNSYMTYLVRNYITADRDFSKPISNAKAKADILIPRGKTFEEYVEKTISRLVGKKVSRIAKLKTINYKEFNQNSKNCYSSLALRIFGVKSNSVPYLSKADISIKAIRIGKNNNIEQSISFPPFKFKDIVTEDKWEESKTYTYLSERKFLLIIFKETENSYILSGYQFLSLDAQTLDEHFKPVWEKTKRILIEGVKITRKQQIDKIIYTNTLPGISENGVCHIRPHSNNRAYRLADGTEIGNVTRDANEMPDGQWMTNQSFWLNKGYLISKLNHKFFEQ